MLEPQKSAPWYKKRILLLALPVLLVVAGLVWGVIAWQRSTANDAQYDALDQHRQQQATQAPPAATASVAATPVPQASASPSPGTVAAAPAAPSRGGYWTNFRGPKRDGKYDQTPV